MKRVHSTRLRVYYEDTDAGGIVYHANYLRFFERARTDWFRALGATHRELAERDGLLLVVRDCAVQFLRPARLDDELEIDVALTELKRASLRLVQTARLADSQDVLASASIRIAAVIQHTGRPAAVPGWVIAKLEEQTAR